MNDLYIQIRKDIRKGREMRELAIGLNEKGIELRKLQDDLYKKTQFKKNFLKARDKQRGKL